LRPERKVVYECNLFYGKKDSMGRLLAEFASAGNKKKPRRMVRLYLAEGPGGGRGDPVPSCP